MHKCVWSEIHIKAAYTCPSYGIPDVKRVYCRVQFANLNHATVCTSNMWRKQYHSLHTRNRLLNDYEHNIITELVHVQYMQNYVYRRPRRSSEHAYSNWNDYKRILVNAVSYDVFPLINARDNCFTFNHIPLVGDCFVDVFGLTWIVNCVPVHKVQQVINTF